MMPTLYSQMSLQKSFTVTSLGPAKHIHNSSQHNNLRLNVIYSETEYIDAHLHCEMKGVSRPTTLSCNVVVGLLVALQQKQSTLYVTTISFVNLAQLHAFKVDKTKHIMTSIVSIIMTRILTCTKLALMKSDRGSPWICLRGTMLWSSEIHNYHYVCEHNGHSASKLTCWCGM